MQSNRDRLILAALDEDIPTEDLSTNAIITDYTKGRAELLCKQDGIIAGLDVFARTFTLLDDSIEVIFHCQEGDTVQSGELLAEVIGDIRIILTGERTALNYLQRMSGIATHTRKLVDLLEGSGITLLDTRKTTPNNRIFEKYAVKVGGGSNHRFSLSDGVMLKDNHIAAAGGIKQAVAAARAYASFIHKIEVEVENLEMVKEAIAAKADIIMLDNMTPTEMTEAVRLIDGRALVECSGNLTAKSIAALRDTGVDYLSSGALTHSSAILDLSLKNLKRI